MKLYHYCCAHSAPKIQDDGVLKPNGFLLRAVWATDLERPDRDALGLTSNFIQCDRTEYRVVVDGRHFTHWFKARADVSPAIRDGLELAPGVTPGNWYVSFEDVPVMEIWEL